MTRTFKFYLHLSPAECRQYYEGFYKSIQVVAQTGQRIQFPAEHIRTFVTANGIDGLFELELEANNKFRSLQKLSN
jgi:hypothetical protein